MERNRHCGAVGRAVVSHFSYFPSVGALESFTNLLELYEEVAVNVTGRPLLPIREAREQVREESELDEEEEDDEEEEEEGEERIAISGQPT